MFPHTPWISLFLSLFLVATGCDAQSPPARSAEAPPLKIVTWNLEWFYDANRENNESDLAREQSAVSAKAYQQRLTAAAAEITALAPDILAVQEIENRSVLKQLADAVKKAGGKPYRVVFIQGRDRATEQDVGVLVSEHLGRVNAERIEEAEPNRFRDRDRYQWPSKHLAVKIDRDGKLGVGPLVLITAHLKAGPNRSDEEQRIRQARVINEYATLMMERGWHAVALGDFNASEPYDKTTAQNAMGVLTGLDSPGTDDDLIDLHAKLPANGRGTHGTNRELDRIATSLSLANGPKWKLESIRVATPTRGVPRADSREWDNPNRRFEPGAAVSDHFPVEAVFKRK